MPSQETSRAMHAFMDRIMDAWRRALSRRSQTAHTGTTWAIMRRLADQYFPQVRILHPYPHERLGVTT
jgi:RNA-directed DNA polymerase